jgi:hypothetical protein
MRCISISINIDWILTFQAALKWELTWRQCGIIGRAQEK